MHAVIADALSHLQPLAQPAPLTDGRQGLYVTSRLGRFEIFRNSAGEVRRTKNFAYVPRFEDSWYAARRMERQFFQPVKDGLRIEED